MFYPDWRRVSPDAWRWPHFTARELACQGSGALLVVPDFLDRLERVRVALDRPLRVTSGYRSPAHNARVSTTGRDGPHTTGRAIDLACHGRVYLDLLALALDEGFTGIGSHQRGPWAGRYLHLDDLDAAWARGQGTRRPHGWTY